MMDFSMNLQLFAGERTEKATPRRREEARKKGQVAKSNELVTVVVLTLSLLMLQSWIPAMMREFDSFYRHVFTYAGADMTPETARNLVVEVLTVTAKMAGPILLIALTAGYAANVMQIGFLFTTEPFKFDLNRLSPARGLQRIFSKRAVSELIKSILKICLVGYIAFSFLADRLSEIAVLMGLPVGTSIQAIGDISFTAAWRVIAVLVILAVCDYGYQVYEYEQSLKMSKQEIKEEYKTIEGDPLLRAKIRERQRQLATRRMMQEVPRATVVITNPTHVAVALRYEDEMDAPQVVAKGQDWLAAKIREVAAANNVTVVENKSLAWLLFNRVDIGMSIPVDLYKAVAEVIAYVYRLKRRV